MKRNKIIQSNNQGKQIEHKRRIAFHEAGHATAIHLNNKARNLPPIFFQIMFKDLNCESEKNYGITKQRLMIILQELTVEG